MKKSLLSLLQDARKQALPPQGERQSVVDRLKEVAQTLSPESAAWILGLVAACEVPLAVELSGVAHSPYSAVAIAATHIAEVAIFACAAGLRSNLQKTDTEVRLAKALEKAIEERDKKWMDEKMLWKEIPKAARGWNPHPILNDGQPITFSRPRPSIKDPHLPSVLSKSLGA